jgi:hypothetical protein
MTAILNISPKGADFEAVQEGALKPLAEPFEYRAKNRALQSELGENYWLDNLLGQPVFMPVRLGGIDLPNPVISITGSKTVIETPIVGQEGTVKEIISTNDYEIRIRCFVKDDSDQYPEMLVRKISDLYKQNRLLTIECVLTDFFLQPKDNCVITGIYIPESESTESMELIELTLKSDREFEIILS